MSEHSTARHLRMASQNCRQGWKALGKWVAKAKGDGETWPIWCLVPDDAWDDIVRRTFTMGREGFMESAIQAIDDRIALPVLASWRLSKGVYRFNSHFKSELMRSTLDGDVPTDVLKRLPEWCIYIEMDGVFESEEFRDVSGVWVLASHGSEGDRINITTDGGGKARNYRCLLSDKPIADMVELSIRNQDDVADLGMSLFPDDSEVTTDTLKNYSRMGSRESQTEMLTKVMNALLYICSAEPDIEDREEPEAMPTLARTKLVGKRDMFVAADRTRIWHVGDKIGEQIRQYNEQPADRKHTRRHLRRAHWHGYWVGPRGSDERSFTYKWLSPMVVGVGR